MADISITKFRIEVPRDGATPSTPGFAVSEGQDPVNPPGTTSGVFVPYSGATQSFDLGEFGMSAGFMKYDTTPTNTPTDQGTTYWDVDDNTLAIIMNGAIQKVGEDSFYPVKNQTGSTILKGRNVRFAGSLGSSGRLLIAPFLADGTYRSSFYMGVTMEDIEDGEDGKVMWFGRIRGINTNDFNANDTLYVSTTSAGGFQTTIPESPNNIIEVCAVINKSTTNGVIFVRPTIAPKITEIEGVKIVSPTNGQTFVYNSTNLLWENKGHNDIAGKQGGDGTNFFHLGNEQYNYLTNPKSAGEVWVAKSFPFFALGINPFIFGNGIFLFSRGNSLLRSTDYGESWTTFSFDIQKSITSLGYGNGLFIAFIYDQFTLSYEIRTSTNGSTWTLTPTPPPNGQVRSAVFANDIFVAVGNNGFIITSPDGITWTQRTSPNTRRFRSVTYGKGLFVAVSDDGTGGRTIYSSDGITWLASTSLTIDCTSVTYFNGYFIAINGFSSNNRARSTDGIIWTVSSLTGSGKNTIISTPFCALIIAESNPRIQISYNGLNFTSVTSPYTGSHGYGSVAFGDGVFIAIGDNGSTGIAAKSGTKNFLNHSQLNFDDGRNPHGTRYEDLQGSLPSIASQIDSSAEKTTVADNDLFALVDSAASNVLKKLKWSSVKTVLQTFLDTLYAPIGRSSIEQVDYVDAWYTHPITSTGSKQLNDGQQFYVPINHMIYAKANMEITAIAFRTSAAPGATSLIRVAIYERTTANNLSLVADFGNTSMDVVGTITFTFTTPATLSKGKLYYVTFKKDNTGTSGATFQGVTTSPEHTQFLFAPSPANMFQTNHALYKTSIATGAFPSTDTLPTESSDQIIPRFQFRLETL